MPGRIKEYSPAATGKQPDLYRIKDPQQLRRYSVEDPNFIEDYFAQHQDFLCNKILDSLIDCGGLLPRDQAVELMLLLLSFKLRSPELRGTFEDKEVAKAVFERRLQELKTESKNDRDYESIFANVEEKVSQLIDHPDLATNVHTDGILGFLSGQDSVVHEVAAMLLNAKWYFYESQTGSLFVTSDNPGFTVDKDNTPHNLNFSEAVAFYFPISPSYCLICADVDSDYDKNDTYKKVHPVIAGGNVVRIVNASTYKVSYKYVYSSDELILKQTWNDIQTGW